MPCADVHMGELGRDGFWLAKSWLNYQCAGEDVSTGKMTMSTLPITWQTLSC